MGDRGKTIVITTHYIEEAKQANVVGLLRNGRLLAEDPPQVSNFLLILCQEHLKLSILDETFSIIVSHEMKPVPTLLKSII